MKTLDEVIDNFEKACDLERRCENCSGCLGQENGCPNDGANAVPDALYYLKKLRDITDISMEYFENGGTSQELRKTSQFSCPKCHSEFVILPEANNPLTWDELKTMEGKPVFVEERYRNGDLKSSGWWLIDFWNDDQICMRDPAGNPWNEHRSNYGRDWQAYRKERK